MYFPTDFAIPEKKPKESNNEGLTKEDLVLCSNCGNKQTPASINCIDCNKSYCQLCDNVIHSITVFSNHTRNQINKVKREENAEEKQIQHFCEVHEESLVTLYCPECEKLICLDCLVESHQKHGVIKPEKACELYFQPKEMIEACELIKNSSNLMNENHEILLKEKNNLTKQKKEAYAKITQKSKILYQEVENKIKSLRAEVDNKIDVQIINIDKKIVTLEKNKKIEKNIKTNISNIKKAIQNSDHTHWIKNALNIKRLAKISSKKIELPTIEKQYFQDDLDITTSLNSIKKITILNNNATKKENIELISSKNEKIKIKFNLLDKNDKEIEREEGEIKGIEKEDMGKRSISQTITEELKKNQSKWAEKEKHQQKKGGEKEGGGEKEKGVKKVELLTPSEFVFVARSSLIRNLFLEIDNEIEMHDVQKKRRYGDTVRLKMKFLASSNIKTYLSEIDLVAIMERERRKKQKENKNKNEINNEKQKEKGKGKEKENKIEKEKEKEKEKEIDGNQDEKKYDGSLTLHKRGPKKIINVYDILDNFKIAFFYPEMNYDSKQKIITFNGTYDHPITIKSKKLLSPNILNYFLYFEVKLLEMSENTAFGVGAVPYNHLLMGMPGWRDSIGYHSDDGKCFINDGFGDKYGPLFNINDIVGLAINFKDKYAFYTLNGQKLNVVGKGNKLFQNFIAPAFGWNHGSVKFQINLGSSPFAYDIENDKNIKKRSFFF
ncbi:ran-binding protein 9/10 [Anaeramoeba flamelloides]|uniref:Ran-binding protein 9/10 n=1 Tax=Anaeramoeba flamelloides TaxID=1746091 RepID=A0AAV7ZEX1_9EUKA|nr:ran-binding protein 9/10 [Anaeramoeba flamelloides]